MMRLVTLEEVMKRLDTYHLMSLSYVVGTTAGATDFSPGLREFFAPNELRQTVRGGVALARGDCERYGLQCSLATCDKLLRLLDEERRMITVGEIYDLVQEMRGRIQDEIGVACCLVLSPQEHAWYLRPLEGWEDIVRRFPQATIDIEEAKRCLALERYAAAVFHSCLAVEAGLVVLGTFLAVTDPRPGFTSVTAALSKIIKKDHGDRTPFEVENFDFIEQVHASAEALKRAWRNKVSHTQGRLVVLSSDFKHDVAEDILSASRAFLRWLAESIPVEEDPPL